MILLFQSAIRASLLSRRAPAGPVATSSMGAALRCRPPDHSPGQDLVWQAPRIVSVSVAPALAKRGSGLGGDADPHPHLAPGPGATAGPGPAAQRRARRPPRQAPPLAPRAGRGQARQVMPGH